jgi:hypothetical protein
MQPASLALLAWTLSAPLAFAQSDRGLRPLRIQAPIRMGGTYHLAQGTWTRSGQQNLAAFDVVYNNTCTTGYYAGMSAGQVYTDEGRVPGPGVHDTPTTKPGCAAAYRVDAFVITYCTTTPTTEIDMAFRESYAPCGPLEDSPVTASFQLTGMPSSQGGQQTCWLITIDLAGTTTLPDRSFVIY